MATSFLLPRGQKPLLTLYSLTKILVRGNQLGGEGGKLLREAVQGREGFELEL